MLDQGRPEKQNGTPVGRSRVFVVVCKKGDEKLYFDLCSLLGQEFFSRHDYKVLLEP